MMSSNNGFSLFDLWAVCRSHSVVFVGSVLTFFFLAVAYAVVATPVYRVEALMMPTDDLSVSGYQSALGGISGLGVLAGLMPSEKGTVEAIATFNSNAFLGRFIDAHDLMPVLYEDRWDTETGSWKRELEQDSIPTLSDAIEKFKRDVLSIDEQSATGLTTLAIEWRDPEIAAAWANRIVSDLNAELQEREISEAESMISYLQAELERTNIVGLQQAIFSLLEQQVQRKTLARVRAEYAFRVIDPATAPEIDDYARPNRPALAMTGLMGGFIIGTVLALIMNHIGVLRRQRSAGT